MITNILQPIDYHQLSDELLSFVDQKTDGDWRATQQIEVLWCTDPRANNYNPNATKMIDLVIIV